MFTQQETVEMEEAPTATEEMEDAPTAEHRMDETPTAEEMDCLTKSRSNGTGAFATVLETSISYIIT